MGRPKVVTIDDSKPKEESQESRVKNLEKKAAKNQSSPAVIPSEVEESVSTEPDQQIATDSANPRNDNSEKEAKNEAEPKKSQKPGKSKKFRSKTYQEKKESLDKTKTYSLNEALEMVKNGSYSKFVGTLEAHINTPNTGIRGLVTLPHAAGKKIRILAFGTGAEESGADIVGTEEVIEEINKGKINFDLVVTTPQWMPKLAKVARILGPRGIMPNPKNGTITDDIKKAVEGFQAGKTEYKTEGKAPIIHMTLGKLDQPTEELSANVKALVITLGKSRIKKLTLAPTIGPSVKVSLNSI